MPKTVNQIDEQAALYTHEVGRGLSRASTYSEQEAWKAGYCAAQTTVRAEWRKLIKQEQSPSTIVDKFWKYLRGL